ncbi:ABC-three component system middle component 6 [Pseudarthrobacter siccitolerans]|uniref:ABC-three component system middle component 6 n=1 Tax=Pseudarthrobacter siccitolerans TaxID=861266 RepID=UPI0006796A47|nr:ABC-three component system middle component 6 [Pseudarthrobacter siccitolerans]
MITPTKGIAPQRALLSVSAQISLVLVEPMTVTQTWAALKSWRTKNANDSALSYSWFILGLDMLYALGALRLESGLIYKVVRS